MISVKLTNGVFNAYLNPSTGTYYDFNTVDWVPPPGASAVSFASEGLARQRLGSIKVVGTPLPMSHRPAVNAPTEAEVNLAMGKAPLPSVPYALLKEELTQTANDHRRQSLLNLFKMKRLSFAKSLRATERKYLSGMAAVILALFPDMEQELLDAVNIADPTSKGDLI